MLVCYSGPSSHARVIRRSDLSPRLSVDGPSPPYPHLPLPTSTFLLRLLLLRFLKTLLDTTTYLHAKATDTPPYGIAGHHVRHDAGPRRQVHTQEVARRDA